ncbi:MAG: CotH kinase family protein, partial [Candidatus Latescibacterota bacterium]|nr:CotH kinase family protein [Candidatus Latescibacterota bacterium]
MRFMIRQCLAILILFGAEAAPAQDGEIDLSPVFSASRGFYRDPFDLTIAAADQAAVKYTLDGSDPRTSSTAQRAATPLVLRIDPLDFSLRDRSPAVIVRATLANDPFVDVTTHTYLFINQIRHLSPDGEAPGALWAPPGKKDQFIDYGLDPEILNDARYADLIEEAFLAIPTFAISTAIANIFDADIGIYLNATERGRLWERPASVELLYPNGDEGFQIDAGLRIRGGYSRNDFNPKHAFRLFFRSEYGAAKLKYPLFGAEGAQSFDKIDLRASQNYAWSNGGYEADLNIMNRDVFSRDTQRDMGRPHTRSDYYHLYLNGSYWGLFQTQERAEAAYAATYFGGGREDYDVVKVDPSEFRWVVEATDGDLESWRRVFDLTQQGYESNENYYRLQGMDPDGRRNPDRDIMVDIDNLIDYMLIIFYGGNFDAPVSKFLSNKKPNNFFAIYDRRGGMGFRFFVHDAEHTLLTRPFGPGIGLEENRVNIGNLSGGERMTVSAFENFHPQWLHHRLTAHPAYRARFADRVQQHFFDGGALTAAAALTRFLRRAAQIETAIIAESARWGDAHAGRARTQRDWREGIDHLVDNYFPLRGDIVLGQLQDAGLFPTVFRAIFAMAEGPIAEAVRKVPAGTSVIVENPNGNGRIFYTLDGSDPRLPDGRPSPAAQTALAATEIEVFSTSVLKARVLGTKSVPQEALSIFAEGLTEGWRVDVADGADTPELAHAQTVRSGRVAAAFSVSAAGFNRPWEIAFSADGRVAEYGSLSFAFHPGDARGQPVGLLFVSVNDHLVGLTRSHVDLSRPEWQLVELPLDAFELETSPRKIAILGNLTGTFYLDDVRLVPRAPDAETGPETWSTLRQLILEVEADLGDIRVSEIHYNPLPGEVFADRDMEFIELYNAGDEPLDLSLAAFTDGIDYTFPAASLLLPGRFIVLAADSRAFASRYGSAPFGEFSGQLNNGGERLTLSTPSGDPIFDFKYDDDEDWPEAADGDGFSLVLQEGHGRDLSDWRQWRQSAAL